jgi:hypothetical protein
VHEQAVLPLGRIVRGELLVGADQLAEQRMISERLEPDPVGRAVDLQPALGTRTTPAASELERPGACDLSRAVRRKRLGTNLQVGEAPRLVLRRGQRRAR